MNDTQSRIAIANALDDDPKGNQIIDLVEVDPLPLHFEINGVEMLGAPGNIPDNSMLAELVFDALLDIIDVFLTLFPTLGDFSRQVVENFRVQIAER